MTVDTDVSVDNIEELSDQCCCSICSESFESSKFIPRSLDCGHTFCEGCIYNPRLRLNGVVKCPMCQRQTDLPDGKVLAINYFALSIAEKLIKSRADPKVTCKECNLKFSPGAVRICVQEGCKMFNQLVCLSCVLDGGHGGPGHSVKYDAKMEKIRAELKVKIKHICTKMEETKKSVLQKTIQLANMSKALETRFSEVNVPAHIIGQLDTLASESEAKEYMEIVDDLAETLMSGCTTLSDVLDTALTTATQQFDDLFGDEEIVDVKREMDEGDVVVIS